VFLAWYNLRNYGAVFTTGYGDVSSLFGLRFFPHNFVHFFVWASLLLSPPLVVAAFSLPWLPPRRRPTSARMILLATWIAAFVGFYAFYFYSGQTWWYLRFILPAFPPLIVGGLLAARHWLGRQPFMRVRWLWFVLPALIGLWQIALNRHLHTADVKHEEVVYQKAADWMLEHVPENAIVLSQQTSGSLIYYTHFTIVRWDLINPEQAKRLYAAAKFAGRPVYAALFDFEVENAFDNHLPGRWHRLAGVRRVSMWRLDATQGGF
jgi:hypothetical protein